MLRLMHNQLPIATSVLIHWQAWWGGVRGIQLQGQLGGQENMASSIVYSHIL